MTQLGNQRGLRMMNHQFSFREPNRTSDHKFPIFIDKAKFLLTYDADILAQETKRAYRRGRCQ